MPRMARQTIENGYQHVIIRGIGKQILFENDADYMFFLKKLKKYSEETEVGICAYCLMENHVHMLIHNKDDQIKLLMKKLGVSYAKYYNQKYERIGHLFQDRYLSENIYDQKGYLTVLRYILLNPQKAGICRAGDYKWSSYHMYGLQGTFMDQSQLMLLFDSKNKYIEFIETINDDECLEYDYKKNDEWAKRIIRKRLNIESGTVIQNYDRCKRDESIRILKHEGISVRQIERLTGLNRGVIQNA